MDSDTELCVASKPSIWHRLGWRYRSDESLFDWRNKEEEGFAPHALCTRTEIHITFVDRLRLLISGRCELTAYTKTDKLVDHAVTRAQFAVLPPSS